VSYATVAKDTHDIYKKYPMYEIGFDHSGVGQGAIELFDNITLPMIPIETTNRFKVDMFNSAQILLETGQLKLAKKFTNILTMVRTISSDKPKDWLHPIPSWFCPK